MCLSISCVHVQCTHNMPTLTCHYIRRGKNNSEHAKQIEMGITYIISKFNHIILWALKQQQQHKHSHARTHSLSLRRANGIRKLDKNRTTLSLICCHGAKQLGEIHQIVRIHLSIVTNKSNEQVGISINICVKPHQKTISKASYSSQNSCIVALSIAFIKDARWNEGKRQIKNTL